MASVLGDGQDFRPAYRVAVFGLAHRMQRILEIVLRHARHNPYRFELTRGTGTGGYDIALVDMTARDGRDAARALLQLQQRRRLVKVGRRADAARGQDDLLLRTFTMDVLKVLNRVVAPRQADPRRMTRPAPVAARSLALSASAHPAMSGGRHGHAPMPGAAASAGSGSGPRWPWMTWVRAPARLLAAGAAALLRQSGRAGYPAEPGASTRRRGEPVLRTVAARALPVPDASTHARAGGPTGAPSPRVLAHRPVHAGGIEGQPRVPAVVLQPPPAARPLALIVDDSPTVRSQLLLVLAQLGVDGQAVASGEQALSLLGTRRFDLALVDVMLPGMDGLRLVREIRAVRALRRMPVSILTTRSAPLDLARGALAGCTSYLVKPVSLRTLHDTLGRQLAERGWAIGREARPGLDARLH